MFRLRLCKQVTQISQKCYSSGVSNDKIGFIGLGNMGGFMAANLAKTNHKLLAFDMSEKAKSNLFNLVPKESQSNISMAQSIGEVGSECKTIITMLPSSPQVLDVFESPKNGLLHNVQPGTFYMDCTTGDPIKAQALEKSILAKGCQYVDSPVSGGVVAAESGQLTFMVGGTTSNLERARPILKHMGKAVFHCGDHVGAGLAAKICNNMMLAISMIGVSEVMHLGQALGLDSKVFASIVNASSGRCWASEIYNPVPGVLPNVPSSKDYNGGFATAMMLKDLYLAMDLINETKSTAPLGTMSHQLFKIMKDKGLGNKDFSVIYKYLNEKQ